MDDFRFYSPIHHRWKTDCNRYHLYEPQPFPWLLGTIVQIYAHPWPCPQDLGVWLCRTHPNFPGVLGWDTPADTVQIRETERTAVYKWLRKSLVRPDIGRATIIVDVMVCFDRFKRHSKFEKRNSQAICDWSSYIECATWQLICSNPSRKSSYAARDSSDLWASWDERICYSKYLVTAFKQATFKFLYRHRLPAVCFEVVLGTILLVLIRIKFRWMVFFLQKLVCDHISFCTSPFFSSMVSNNSAQGSIS